MSGLPITATGPDSGVSTPSLIVVPSKPGPVWSSASPPPSPSRFTLVGGTSAAGDHERQQRDDPEHPLHYVPPQYENGHALKYAFSRSHMAASPRGSNIRNRTISRPKMAWLREKTEMNPSSAAVVATPGIESE